jgi:hypothetical protein
MAMSSQRSPAARATPARRPPAMDVVSAASDARTRASLGAALGFRVDGPDGRIGVLRDLAPAEASATCQRLIVRTGLFLVTAVSVPVTDVVSVDAARRRILVRSTPQLAHRPPAELARHIRRFLRAAARRAADDRLSATTGRQR